MNDWIEVRVRGCVNGHEFDRTMTGDGAVVQVLRENEDVVEGEFALLGEWSITKMTSHLKHLAKSWEEDMLARALMLMMVRDDKDDSERDISAEAEAEAAANAVAEEMELASEELARRAVAEGCRAEADMDGLNCVEGDGEEPVTPVE